MKLKIQDIPMIMEGPGTVMRRQAGLGNLDIGYIELPQCIMFSPDEMHGKILDHALIKMAEMGE